MKCCGRLWGDVRPGNVVSCEMWWGRLLCAVGFARRVQRFARRAQMPNIVVCHVCFFCDGCVPLCACLRARAFIRCVAVMRAISIDVVGCRVRWSNVSLWEVTWDEVMRLASRSPVVWCGVALCDGVHVKWVSEKNLANVRRRKHVAREKRCSAYAGVALRLCRCWYFDYSSQSSRADQLGL